MNVPNVPLYEYDESHEVVRDYAEYAGLPVAEIASRINACQAVNRDEWLKQPGTTWEEKAGTFYANASGYIFDLLHGNRSRAYVRQKLDHFEPRILQALEAQKGSDVLDFGGGTGTFCHLMHDAGMNPTYLDLEGPVPRFAAWRFAKHGLPIRRIISSPTRLELDATFDLVFSDAVFEHLIDPVGVTRTLAAHLRAGGFFALLVDLEGHTEDMPMHRDVDVDVIHGTLEESGLVCEFGRGRFASGWRKPNG